MAMSLIHIYYGYEIDRLQFKFPRDWWEAFKERWFPEWARKRWPVVYEMKIWKREAALLDIPIKDHRYKLYLRDVSHLESWRDENDSTQA